MAFKDLDLRRLDRRDYSDSPESFRVSIHATTAAVYIPNGTHQGFGWPAEGSFPVRVQGDPDAGLVRIIPTHAHLGPGHAWVRPTNRARYISMASAYREMGIPIPTETLVVRPRLDKEGWVVIPLTKEADRGV